MDPNYTQLQAEHKALESEHNALKQEVADIREFYSTDKLRSLAQDLKKLDDTTKHTAIIQLAVTALTPLLTLLIAIITYNATNNNEAEKNRVERLKLATDMYTKAMAQDSAAVLFNAATVADALLVENKKDAGIAKAIENALLTVARRRIAVTKSAIIQGAKIDSAARSKQIAAIQQLLLNYALKKQASGPLVDNISKAAHDTLAHSVKTANRLARLGYDNLRSNHVPEAQHQFELADYAYPGLYNYWELSRLLAPYKKVLTNQKLLTKQQIVVDSILQHIPNVVRVAIKLPT